MTWIYDLGLISVGKRLPGGEKIIRTHKSGYSYEEENEIKIKMTLTWRCFVDVYIMVEK